MAEIYPLPSDAPCIGTEALQKCEWREGAVYSLGAGPGRRHAIVAVCTAHGDRSATFANGDEYPFTTMVAIAGHDGQVRPTGVHTIPLIPLDPYRSKVVMVVNQRPGLYATPRDTNVLQVGGVEYDLGPIGTLEFPGGSVEPGEPRLKATQRELFEEIGIELAEGATLQAFDVPHPVPLAVAEMVLSITFTVLFLPQRTEEDTPSFVKSDGGLQIFCLTEKELWKAWVDGLLTAASAQYGYLLYERFSFFRWHRIGDTGETEETWQLRQLFKPIKLTV